MAMGQVNFVASLSQIAAKRNALEERPHLELIRATLPKPFPFDKENSII
jgi:hypothetical protein